VLLLSALAASTSVRAQDESSGEFVVRQASSELVDGAWHINAAIDLDLSPEAAGMLRAPVPLTIRIEAQFLNRLRLWWDLVEFQGVVRYQLSYLRVRNRYQVRNLDTNDTQNFMELGDALDYIGRVEDLEVADDVEIDDDHRYEVRVRAVLDKRDLPGPLRLIAFWRKDWSIASDWLTWRLDNE
jgi:hypothetical protein